MFEDSLTQSCTCIKLHSNTDNKPWCFIFLNTYPQIALQVRHRVGSRILRLNAPTSSNSTQRDVPCCDARPPIVAMCMQSKGPSEIYASVVQWH
eukprot:972217-Amorphochlora_amoeboformis.AAC.1